MAMRVAGSGTAFKTFLDVLTQFDRYTSNNALLITAQKPNAKKLGDYNFWKSKNIWIEKDQLQYPILVMEPGKEYVKADGSHGKYYNAKKLYDISQTADKDKEITAVTYDERQLVRALVNNAPAMIVSMEADSMPDGKTAMFVSTEQKIYARKGMSASELFATLTPELIYAEYAKDYRDPTKFSKEKYEFNAYCATYMICKKYGLDTRGFTFEKAPDHFQGKDVKGIKQELSRMKEAMDKISGRMRKVLEAERAGTAR